MIAADSTSIVNPIVHFTADQSVASQESHHETLCSLEASISKIDALINEDKKMCLFIGRTPAERLPPETGEAQADEIWVSANVTNTGPAVSPSRIHLMMDFNDQTSVAMLQSKFHLIVVDWTTIKFFNNDFARRFSVMLRTPESKMIFEAATGCKSTGGQQGNFNPSTYHVTLPSAITSIDRERQVAHLAHYRATTPEAKQKSDWEEFMQSKGNEIATMVPSKMKKTVLESQFMIDLAAAAGIHGNEASDRYAHHALATHLNTIFEQVELKENAPYPYQNNYTGSGTAPHFIVSHPKQQILS